MSVVGFDLLLRDLRHESARAAPDLADWLVHLELEGKATGTLYQYTRQVAPLLRDNPDLAIHEFTPAIVSEQLARVPRQSRHVTRSIWNQFFGWAAWADRITRNPMEKVARIRPAHGRRKDIFSVEEVAILEAQPAPDGQLMTIMFGTGLRRGEAIGLRRDHVDLNRARLMVYQGKGGKDRIVPLPTSVLAAFADIDLTSPLTQDEYVWSLVRSERHRARRWSTHPVGSSTFDRWWHNALTRAGVRYLNPHQCRHTFGELLRERDFSLEERQLLMGHENITTTVRYYGHLTIEDVARKVAAL